MHTTRIQTIVNLNSVWNGFNELIFIPMVNMSQHQQLILPHYNDVIMSSLAIVYSTAYSGGEDQRKHRSSVSLAFVWGIHRSPVNSPQKWPVTRTIFPFDAVTTPFNIVLHLLICSMHQYVYSLIVSPITKTHMGLVFKAARQVEPGRSLVDFSGPFY